MMDDWVGGKGNLNPLDSTFKQEFSSQNAVLRQFALQELDALLRFFRCLFRLIAFRQFVLSSNDSICFCAMDQVSPVNDRLSAVLHQLVCNYTAYDTL
jgi:hypothetical protein